MNVKRYPLNLVCNKMSKSQRRQLAEIQTQLAGFSGSRQFCNILKQYERGGKQRSASLDSNSSLPWGACPRSMTRWRPAALLPAILRFCLLFWEMPFQKHWMDYESFSTVLKRHWLYHYFRERRKLLRIWGLQWKHHTIFRQCSEISSCETTNMTGLNHSKW